MGPARLAEIAVWLDSVQHDQTTPLISPHNDTDDGKENARPVSGKGRNGTAKAQKRRAMNEGMGDLVDLDQTPRPPKRAKRQRELNAAHTPTLSASSSEADVDAESVAESHHSGRCSPTKQLHFLEDAPDNPVNYCTFGDAGFGDEPADVAVMHLKAQRLADGVGILGCCDVSTLPDGVDKVRLQYPWTVDVPLRSKTGSTPETGRVLEIVEAAQLCDRGAGKSEDEWNSEAQLALLKLARATSKHRESLVIQNVKTAKIEPRSLARNELPRRVVDYVVALQADPALAQAWQLLNPLPGSSGVRNWNHTSTNDARRTPFAINIETKSATKSWTDGKAQLAIWTDAWLRRLALIRQREERVWPCLPVLIAQGHDWYLMIVSKNGNGGGMVIRNQICIGGTRSVYDALKAVAVLHYLMDWAVTVWKPWLLGLVAGE